MRTTPEHRQRTPRPVRTSPLSADELWRFYRDGFLRVGRLLDDETVERLRASIAAARRDLTLDSDLLDAATWPDGEGGVPQEPGRNVSFLFNMWRHDDAFRCLVTDPRLAGLAGQALGATAVRLLEDNALTKDAFSGGELKWHQDYAYWPLGQPNAVTVWIALDDVTGDNGAVRMARGSHHLGERLPAVFGTGAVYFRERRPSTVRPIADPEVDGLGIDTLELAPGEASIHHALTWHASGANATGRPRRAAVVRYVADGTTWFGERRYEFNYRDDELGLTPGQPIGGDYFPLVRGPGGRP
jgi:ectoine hydroxylase-related dioxygenase (phytanoyl-CoA dioxygenase family)